MDHHWSHELVAFVGILAGFLLFGVGEPAVLAGPVVAASACAAVLPEFLDAPTPA